jgi:hypothetical protein
MAVGRALVTFFIGDISQESMLPFLRSRRTRFPVNIAGKFLYTKVSNLCRYCQSPN